MQLRLNLARPIEFSNSYNLAAVALSLLAAYCSWSWGNDLIFVFNSFLSVIIAWAIARELDPDHPLAAIVAAVFAFWVFARFRILFLAFNFLLLLLLRVLNKSCGRKPTALDWGLIGFIAILFTLSLPSFTVFTFFLVPITVGIQALFLGHICEAKLRSATDTGKTNMDKNKLLQAVSLFAAVTIVMSFIPYFVTQLFFANAIIIGLLAYHGLRYWYLYHFR